MDRYSSANKVSILGMLCNLFLFIIKIIVGLLFSSQAMVAESMNSAGDIFSSLMTFIGNKIASKDKDEDHNLGHGKAEYIFSMIISLSMMVVAVDLFKSAFLSFFNHSTYTYSIFLVVVSITTIVVKMCLYIYCHGLAVKFDNLLIDANSKDHRNDCVLAFMNLFAALMGKFGILSVDSLVGLLISIWIFYTGAKIFKDSYDVLMDEAINDVGKQKIYDIINTYSEIEKVTHFNSTPVGYKYQISFTIFVDGNLTTFESHDIANRLEKEISKLDEIYLTIIHVNPMKVNKK